MFTRLLRAVLYPREYAIPARNPGAGIEGLVRMRVESDEGDVEGWFLPAEAPQPPEGGAAVIFAHGNAELIDYWPEQMQPYRDMGVSVLLAEYRGYGRSAGNPSQERITADFVKFREWLDARDEVDPDRVIYHGRSLGGGAVAQLAAQRKPAAMILESTFTSVAAMAGSFMVPANFISDPYDTLAVLGALGDVPVLVMHGRRDSVVPFGHGEQLAKAAKNVRFEAFDADHNDFPDDVDRYWRVIREFLEPLRQG